MPDPGVDDVVTIKPFGGLNTTGTEDSIPMGDTPYCENVIVVNGSVRPRPVLSTDPWSGGSWIRSSGVVVRKMISAQINSTPYLVVIQGTGSGSAWTSNQQLNGGLGGGPFALPNALDAFSEPFAFGPNIVVPSVTAPQKINSSGTLGALGGSPPVGGIWGEEYNRMALLRASTTGQVQFSGIDNAESYLSSDTLTAGPALAKISWVKNLGPFSCIGTPYGIFAMEGFGRQSNKTYEISRYIGSPNSGRAAKGDGKCFFFGSDASKWALYSGALSPFSPITGVYSVDSSGQMECISEKIRRGKDPDGRAVSSNLWGYSGVPGNSSGSYVMEYNQEDDILYCIPNPGLNASSTNDPQYIWTLHKGNWSRWAFNRAFKVTSIFPTSLLPFGGLANTWGSGLASVWIPGAGSGNTANLRSFLPGVADSDGLQGSGTLYGISPIWTFPIIDRGETTNILRWLYLRIPRKSDISLRIDMRVDPVVFPANSYLSTLESPWAQVQTKTISITRDRDGWVRIPIEARGRRFQVRVTFIGYQDQWEMSEARFGFKGEKPRGDNPNEQ